LEDLPPYADRAVASAALHNHLTKELAEHARECDSCEEATETFWTSRGLLAGPLELARERRDAALKESRPWFAAQVMAKIAEREMEGRRALAEWSGAVAKLASRLAWISALVLLVGTTWFYGPNGGHLNTPSVQSKAGTAPQYLFDGSAAQLPTDDELANSPER
ncbi:MAG TPA: hypothetical protein VHT31_01090, partial [Candidatus Acidoferrum sp.]|nr:hypothetical protein [Candidatus Acidoferrum sp.]